MSRYLKYALSYRNLEEMMAERGVKVDHTTIMRWVHQYSPEIEKKVRRYLRPTNDSWRMDETYIKVKVRQEAVLRLRINPPPIRLGCPYCSMRFWLTGRYEAYRTTWRRIEP